MKALLNTVARATSSFAAAIAVSGAAFAQAETPSISGNSWVALAIIAGLVLLLLLLISGAISLSKRDDTSDEEDAGFGIFEGIEEDDPKPRKRK